MKFYVRADAYNELIEKGYGKRDFSKLTRKVITDKNGHRRTVFVKNEVQTTNTNSSKAYWIQDFRGNRLTNEDAKKNIKEVNENIKRFESKIENGDKATKVAAEAAIKRMQNYKEDLISKLKPEDRKEFETPVKKETPSNSFWIEDTKRGVKIQNHPAVRNAYDILNELEEKGLGKLTDIESDEFSFEGKDFTIESRYGNGEEHFAVELKEPLDKNPILERMNEDSGGEKYQTKHIIVSYNNKDEAKNKLIYWLTGKK